MTWRPPKTPAHYFPSFPAARAEHKLCFPLKEREGCHRHLSPTYGTVAWPPGAVRHHKSPSPHMGAAQSDRVAIRPLYHTHTHTLYHAHTSLYHAGSRRPCAPGTGTLHLSETDISDNEHEKSVIGENFCLIWPSTTQFLYIYLIFLSVLRLEPYRFANSCTWSILFAT